MIATRRRFGKGTFSAPPPRPARAQIGLTAARATLTLKESATRSDRSHRALTLGDRSHAPKPLSHRPARPARHRGPRPAAPGPAGRGTPLRPAAPHARL